MSKKAGWVSVWRQELDNPIITKSLEHFAVWHLLLLLATAKPRRVLFKGKERLLQPGQLVTTLKELSKSIKDLSEYKLQRVLSEFEKYGQIQQERSNRGRLISLVNWGKYQKSAKLEMPETPHKTVSFDDSEKISARLLQDNCKATAKPVQDWYTNINNNINNNDNVNKLDKPGSAKKTHNQNAPTFEEVKAYCNQQNLKFDIEKFYNYYSQYGWQMQGLPLDWKKSAHNWDATEFRKLKKKQDEVTRSYDIDEWENFSIFD